MIKKILLLLLVALMFLIYCDSSEAILIPIYTNGVTHLIFIPSIRSTTQIVHSDDVTVNNEYQVSSSSDDKRKLLINNNTIAIIAMIISFIALMLPAYLIVHQYL